MEVMKEGTDQYATRYPLKIPKTSPITTLRINAAGIGIPYDVKQYPEINAQQNITGPMEKSIPPVAITKVTPNDKNPRKYA